MKTIGLIGGMSWESSLEYYRLLNEEVHQRLGGYHSAKCVLVSVDFAEIEELQRIGNWADAGRLMANAARALELAGADFIILCTNTMHKLTQEIEDAIHIPFLHIADPTAENIKKAGLERIGLLGTRFTMSENFYKGRLQDLHGISVVTPDEADQDTVHRVIYDELVHGIIRADSRQKYFEIISRLVEKGAQGVVLGCTEIGLLIQPQDVNIPTFDTTILHAQSAVQLSLYS